MGHFYLLGYVFNGLQWAIYVLEFFFILFSAFLTNYVYSINILLFTEIRWEENLIRPGRTLLIVRPAPPVDTWQKRISTQADELLSYISSIIRNLKSRF